MDSLPPTLPKTYERILTRVNNSNVSTQNMVQSTLRWFAYAEKPLSLAELAEIISLKETDHRLDPEAIIDESAIMHWCSSLVRLRFMSEQDERSIVEFSHFTVKEFLLGISQDSEKEFQAYSLAPQKTIGLDLARDCLTYLCLENFASSFPKNAEEAAIMKEEYPFHSHAATWTMHSRGVSDESLLKLSRKLFDPSKSNKFMCWAQEMITLYLGNADFSKLHFDSSTLHWACIVGDTMLCRLLIELGEDFQKPSRLGTPLQCTILGGGAITWAAQGPQDYDFLSYFDPKEGNSERAKVIGLLLAAGANIHTSYVS